MKKKLLSMGDRLMIQSNRYQNRLNRKKMKELKAAIESEDGLYVIDKSLLIRRDDESFDEHDARLVLDLCRIRLSHPGKDLVMVLEYGEHECSWITDVMFNGVDHVRIVS